MLIRGLILRQGLLEIMVGSCQLAWLIIPISCRAQPLILNLILLSAANGAWIRVTLLRLHSVYKFNIMPYIVLCIYSSWILYMYIHAHVTQNVVSGSEASRTDDRSAEG